MKIVLQNLTKKFPGRNKKSSDAVIAVNDFNFEIPDGLLVGLLGPSGCGKSTTLNLICGLESPTEGKIFFGERDVTKLPPENRGVGLVFQNYALYPHLTVEKNIQFPLENLKGADKLTKEQMKERVYEAARLVQIGQLLERKPNELSGGQQQRVAIARALVKMPHVLLLDEPLSNLDARLRLQTREEIRRIQKETQITTIFVTHDQEEAMSISDLIIVMESGILQQIGKPQEVYDNPKNLFVAKFLGTPPINVFDGSIRDGKLYIGEEPVLNIRSAADPSSRADLHNSSSAEKSALTDNHAFRIPDQEVTIGIRPEGFIPTENGALSCNLDRIEVMGRDVSVVSTHNCCQNAVIRSIINAENIIDTASKTVHFDLKPKKTYIFQKETGERIYFEVTD